MSGFARCNLDFSWTLKLLAGYERLVYWRCPDLCIIGGGFVLHRPTDRLHLPLCDR